MSNQIKTFIFLTILTVILILLGSMIGGKNGLIVATIFSLIMNFIAYYFSDKIVLSMYKAREVSEQEAPGLYRIVRYLAQRANLPMPKIYIVPAEEPNAFATGRNPENAAVAVTAGLLKLLNEEELMGVLAHELAHIKNRDILLQTVTATIVGAITFIAEIGRLSIFFGGLGRDEDEKNNPLAVIFFIIMLIVLPIAATMIQLAISRSREYLADEVGAKICGNPLYLANALKKIHDYITQGASMEVNPATAHMFIVNPLSGEKLVNLFSTHPPIEDRIRRLVEMARRGTY